MMNAPGLALLALLSTENPWVDGPEAPVPERSAVTSAPREPGAVQEPLVTPARPPAPTKPRLVSLLPQDAPEPRMATERSRAQLARAASLSMDGALVDVAGLWLQHEQSGAGSLWSRGLPQEQLGVLVDDAPLLRLGGLVMPLEVLSLDGSAGLRLQHGPRVIGRAQRSSAGVLSVQSAGPLRDRGEELDLDGVLAAGIGGPDLEKGVLGAGETGFHRGRVVVHGSVFNREDERQGRSLLPFWLAQPVDAPGAGVLLRSGGNGGAAGIRADVAPLAHLTVFQAWHSARGVEVPRPARCGGSDEAGAPLDCVRTLERGVDLWVAGADASVDMFGVDLVARPRVSIQRALARDERAGSAFPAVERALDQSVGGVASLDAEAVLPRLALLDVWQPRARVVLNASRERVKSGFFSRSLRARDAEPPGEGVADPLRARSIDGAEASAQDAALALSLLGQRVGLSANVRLKAAQLSAPAVPVRLDQGLDVQQLAPEGELSARARVTDQLTLFAALVHAEELADLGVLRGPELGDALLLPADPEEARFKENTAELGAHGTFSLLQADVVLWGSSRSGALAAFPVPGNSAGVRRWARGRVEQAAGVEGSARVPFGVDGLVLEGSGAATLVDVGPLWPLDERRPKAGVLNPLLSLLLSWDPPAWPFGVFARARGILPQGRLSTAEALDPRLCPELPSEADRAAGGVRTLPCSGAEGALLLDLGAHVEAGRLRLDVVGQNLLDREARVRDEPVGSGGLGISALVSVGL